MAIHQVFVATTKPTLKINGQIIVQKDKWIIGQGPPLESGQVFKLPANRPKTDVEKHQPIAPGQYKSPLETIINILTKRLANQYKPEPNSRSLPILFYSHKQL